MIRHIKFKGIDDFNRPVYQVLEYNYFIGSVVHLFNWGTPAEVVNEFFKNKLNELEYFGDHFNCEPTGGKIREDLVLVIQ
jgi:hypothetical protein